MKSQEEAGNEDAVWEFEPCSLITVSTNDGFMVLSIDPEDFKCIYAAVMRMQLEEERRKLKRK
jgi:hypothetical protein